MIKSKHSLFNKTISKQNKKQSNIQQVDPKKTRRTYLKYTKNNDLPSIIKDLQKNVKQLKNYHQSLQKIKTLKLYKSSSSTQINKFNCNNKSKKDSLNKNHNRILKRVSQFNKNKQNISNNKNQVAQTTVSKNFFQNGSTMLSIHNADVDQVKKAYQFTYGKQNTNIVDLYNFFRKNIQKSTRFNGASIQISYPHAQYSQDLIKSRQNINHRKSNDRLNVIIQDRQQKQIPIEASSSVQNQGSSIYKITQRNPTMEQIFKNGCPDLANVFDFLKKRRVSLKNYMNFNKNKQNQPNLANIQKVSQQNKFSYNQYKQQSKQLSQKLLDFQDELQNQQQNIRNLSGIKSPSIHESEQNNKKQMIQEPQLSQQKYLPSKSSKKSHKSSIKKSKHKQRQLIDLDQNLSSAQIKQFNQISNQKKSSQKNKNQQKAKNQIIQFINQNQQKQQKFKKSKYYVEPIPFKKQNSLDGCSISVKSSSRIIQLDFIPLDL